MSIQSFDQASAPFRLRTREDWQGFERQWLAPYARSSATADATRRLPEREHAYRTAFQRDRDRLVHARSFRRLKHKRQVFLITEGDHFRTRMTHTLEVAQISRTVGRALGLNEDLIEAIALGHDLGHTPFGHLGESILDDILQGRDDLDGAIAAGSSGGFKHNYQSVRIVDRLEQKYDFHGLNLTAPVREGILKHTRLKRGQFDFPDFDFNGLFFELDAATTLEGQVVATADEVAQRTHDFEDGLRASLVTSQESQELAIVQIVNESRELGAVFDENEYLYRNSLIKGLISLLVGDIISNTLTNLMRFQQRKQRLHHFDEELAKFSDEMEPLQQQLNKFIYQRIIFHSNTRKSDIAARQLLRSLFRLYLNRPELVPANGHHFAEIWQRQSGDDQPRRIADFIAGMTDSFAISEFKRLRENGHEVPAIDLEQLSGGTHGNDDHL